jgi:hypothetical protein
VAGWQAVREADATTASASPSASHQAALPDRAHMAAFDTGLRQALTIGALVVLALQTEIMLTRNTRILLGGWTLAGTRGGRRVTGRKFG